MNPWRYFENNQGQIIRFRQKHPNESFSGCAGLYALTTIQEHSIVAIRFEAANDLADADREIVSRQFLHRLMKMSGPVGVAVCLMRSSTQEERISAAKSLNEALPHYSENNQAA